MDAMKSLILAIFLLSFSATQVVGNREITKHSSRFVSKASKVFSRDGDAGATRWAVLIAGSKGWVNYRHQADICHAYQVLKKGGLKDENIVVMIYDDIAHAPKNPRPGVIVNSPKGDDVYRGVPKDYVGKDVNGENFFNVILGNKTAIKGGSGKVVNSGPNDYIFIFYSDHGSPRLLGMPNGLISADELNKVLKQKHDIKTYKSMVFYLEACYAGSMFDGLLSPNLNIYATTSSNPHQQSSSEYCPENKLATHTKYNICLGGLYSIAWMEDCEQNSTPDATLGEQYQRVKNRTAVFSEGMSEVMEYGDLSISKEKISVYMGVQSPKDTYINNMSLSEPHNSFVDQRDDDLLYFREKYQRAKQGSQQKFEAKGQFLDAVEHKNKVDSTIERTRELLFCLGKGVKPIMDCFKPWKLNFQIIIFWFSNPF